MPAHHESNSALSKVVLYQLALLCQSCGVECKVQPRFEFQNLQLRCSEVLAAPSRDASSGCFQPGLTRSFARIVARALPHSAAAYQYRFVSGWWCERTAYHTGENFVLRRCCTAQRAVPLCSLAFLGSLVLCERREDVVSVRKLRDGCSRHQVES